MNLWVLNASNLDRLKGSSSRQGGLLPDCSPLMCPTTSSKSSKSHSSPQSDRLALQHFDWNVLLPNYFSARRPRPPTLHRSWYAERLRYLVSLWTSTSRPHGHQQGTSTNNTYMCGYITLSGVPSMLSKRISWYKP